MGISKDAWREIKKAIEQASGEVGLFIKDMATGEVIEHRADERFPAASIIKIPVLVEVLRQAEKGSLRLDKRVSILTENIVGGTGILKELKSVFALSTLDLLTLMIIISDNTAANICIDFVGMDTVNRTMLQYGLCQTLLQRKMMDLTARERGLDNWTTPRESGRLLELILNVEVLSFEMSELAIDVMAKQQINDRIPLYLPEGMRVAHKTGELPGIRHDVGVVFCPDRPVIIAALTKGFTDPLSQRLSGGDASNLIAHVSHCIIRSLQ
jgi:beta-lactamase class A